MIAEFKIKNFLSIKTELCLSFEATSETHMKDEYCIEVKEGVHLLKSAMIYGSNASGKTNILWALSTFQDLLIDSPKDKNEKIDILPFMLDNISRDELTEFEMTFYREQEKYVLLLSLDKSRIHQETLTCYPGTQPAKLYVRTYNKETDSTEIEFGNKLGLSKKSQMIVAGNTINNCSVLAAFGKSNVEATRLNVVYDFFSNYINEILGPSTSLLTFIKKNLDNDENNNLKNFLTDILKASDFNISDLALQQKEEVITPQMEK